MCISDDTPPKLVLQKFKSHFIITFPLTGTTLTKFWYHFHVNESKLIGVIEISSEWTFHSIIVFTMKFGVKQDFFFFFFQKEKLFPS